MTSHTETTIIRTHDGAYVTNGTLDADCTVSLRMDGTTGLCVNGNLTLSDEINSAVLATIEDGETRVIAEQPTDHTAELAAYETRNTAILNMMTLNGQTF